MSKRAKFGSTAILVVGVILATIVSLNWLVNERSLPILPLEEFAGYKDIKIGAGRFSPMGDWVHIDVTDQDVLDVIAGGGSLQMVRQPDGKPLATRVIHQDRHRARLVVDLPTMPLGETVLCRLYFDERESGPRYETWHDEYTASRTTVGPEIVIHDGLGELMGPMDEWVHPYVLKVPDDSWMRSIDADDPGSVTHIRIDTPYPNTEGRYRWENPYLLYSTDDGATWAEWPGVSNPIAPYPGGGDYNSDPCLVLKSNGNLAAFYRRTDSENDIDTLHFRIASGENLTDVQLTEEVQAQTPKPHRWLSPSIVKHDGTWYLFVCAHTNPIRGSEGLWRWESVDRGRTWANSTMVFGKGDSTGDREAFGYWHGSFSGPFSDGYYYGLYSETIWHGRPHQDGADFRLFRMRDPSGEPPQLEGGKLFAVRRGEHSRPDWFKTGAYHGTLYEKTDGSTGLFFSGLQRNHRGQTYRVSRLDFDADDPTKISEDVAFGYSRPVGRAFEADSPLAIFDLETDQGLRNLAHSNGAQALSIVGNPDFERGVGWIFSRNDDRLETDITLEGMDELELTVDFTLPSSAENRIHPLVGAVSEEGMSDATEPAMLLAVLPDTGALRFVLGLNDEQHAYTHSAHDYRDDRRHSVHVSVLKTNRQRGYGSRIQAYVNGIRVWSESIAEGASFDSPAGPITIGGVRRSVDSSGFRSAQCTIHAFRMESAPLRNYGEGVQRYMWQRGVTLQPRPLRREVKEATTSRQELWLRSQTQPK